VPPPERKSYLGISATTAQVLRFLFGL